MSSTYMTEQQQIEQLKGWWKTYGVSTAIIFVLAILLSIGWHFWLKHREDKLARASGHYEELLNAVVNDDESSVVKQSNLLKSNYDHTPYAALASLMLARSDVAAGNYDSAKAQLTWVMQHANTSSLRQVARLRLARILLQEGKPQESLKLLQKINDTNYQVVINELTGDSYLALKQPKEARNAYQQALTALPDYAALRPIVLMKLDDLAQDDASQTPKEVAHEKQ